MTSTHGEPRLGHPDDNLGEFAEELKLLAEAVLERVEPVLRRTAADGRSDWDSCSWCPVCAAAAIVRGEHHDVVAAIADHGTAIVTVLREALAGVPVEPVIPPDLDPDSAEYQAWQHHSHSRLAEDLADAYANARGSSAASQGDPTGRRTGAAGQGGADWGDNTAAAEGATTGAGRRRDAAGEQEADAGVRDSGAGRRDSAAGRGRATGAGQGDAAARGRGAGTAGGHEASAPAAHRAGDAESSSAGRGSTDAAPRSVGAGLSGVFARFLAGAQGHSSGAPGHAASGHAAPAAPAGSAGVEDAPVDDSLGNGPGAARRPESGRRKPGYVPINVTIKA
ncbi:hypothetical protein [Nocardia sp. NPDC020380]|uniref:hypothetical protein n=1 Tax=Nocardia sp. NPDC020380 TaxID=3364309 RepID=UPI0037B7C897